MTLTQIKNTVMFQTGNDAEDVQEFLPFLTDYINEGYDILYHYINGAHLGDEDADEKLSDGGDEPALATWLQPALADYATWMVYRNGNLAKQNRGMIYRQSFEDYKNKIHALNGQRQFYNLYNH